MLLAIDTATDCLSLVLHDGEALLAEVTLRARRRHSALLAPLIQQLMAQAQVDMADLTALAVAVGPGSYTGARIGVALAKGMAAARSLPLVPVTTLEVVAESTRPGSDGRRLIATVAAGRGRVIWAVYQWRAGGWSEARAAGISAWDELIAACHAPILVSGEVSTMGADALRKAVSNGADIEIATPAERLRRVGFLAQIAWRRLRANEERADFAADQVAPIYISGPG